MKSFISPSLGRISFNVRHLCMGLISALSSLAWSRHNLTLPFAFRTSITCCIILMSHPHPGALWCVAFVTFLAPLLGVPIVHMLPFQGHLISLAGSLHLSSKCAFKADYAWLYLLLCWCWPEIIWYVCISIICIHFICLVIWDSVCSATMAVGCFYCLQIKLPGFI